jgi:phosphoesterase RecJ-like protein
MIYSFTDIQINRAFYLIKKSKNILLVAHRKPDSDTIGSVLALNDILKKLEKNIYCYCQDRIPEKFNFLLGSNSFISNDEILSKISEIDLVITLDSGSINMAGIDKLPFEKVVPIVNIDHHQDSTYYGKINIIKGNTSSTAEIIYDILERVGLPINKEVATCLLTGIFGDTDSFKNPNTTDRTLIITSRLLAAGARLKQITRYTLQDKSLPTIKLWGEILSRIERHNDLNMVSTVITHEDLKRSSASYDDLEGISNFLNSIPEACASLVLTEREGEIKGSLRTLRKNIDVSKIAHLFGGGGHKKAAGFTIPGQLVKKEGKWKIINN